MEANRSYTRWTPRPTQANSGSTHCTRDSVVAFGQGPRSGKQASSPNTDTEKSETSISGSFAATLAAVVAREDTEVTPGGSGKAKTQTGTKPKPKQTPKEEISDVATSAGDAVSSETPARAHATPKPRQRRRAKKKTEGSSNSNKADENSPKSFDDDGGWRRRSKEKLSADIDRYVDVAIRSLDFQRRCESEAAAAAPPLVDASKNSTQNSEGTVIGRSGATMTGLRLTSARPSSGKSGRLLNMRPACGGALPSSALAVGDRVAAVFVDGSLSIDRQTSDVSRSIDAPPPPAGVTETVTHAEAVIVELDAIGGVVTLLEAKTDKTESRRSVGASTKTLSEMLAGLKSLEELLAGRLVRLVRVPDNTTWERQLTALRTLRNVPTSRTNPPAALVVRALFSENRCPPIGFATQTNADADGVDENANGTTVHETPETKSIPGHFSTAPDVRNVDSKVKIKRVPLADFPELNLGSVQSGGGGPYPDALDDQQRLAVRAALSKNTPVCWIQGPPGTGKTKVVIEIIRRAVRNGERVLACAPSNAAVDNLVERLAAVADSEREAGVGINSISFVRIGAPERISDAAHKNSLEQKVRDKTAGYFDRSRDQRRRELADAAKVGFEARDAARGGSGNGGAKINKKALDEKLKELRKEQRGMAVNGRKTRAAAERDVLQHAQVVLCTTVGAGAENVQKLPAFDLLVLDEAAQATEPSSWIPLVRCHRVVFVGDPSQLAPLVRSQDALGLGLAVPIMTRIALPQQRRSARGKEKKPAPQEREPEPAAVLSHGVVGCALRTQYRSHAAISDWASSASYDGDLVAHVSVATGLLKDLPGVVATRATSSALLLIDTRVAGGVLLGGCGEVTERELLLSLSDSFGDEGDGTRGTKTNPPGNLSSLVNEGEAYLVTMHVAGLLRSGLNPTQIAVQSPYAAQVRLLQVRVARFPNPDTLFDALYGVHSRKSYHCNKCTPEYKTVCALCINRPARDSD